MVYKINKLGYVSTRADGPSLMVYVGKNPDEMQEQFTLEIPAHALSAARKLGIPWNGTYQSYVDLREKVIGHQIKTGIKFIKKFQMQRDEA